jgi:hypothetical protein
VLHMDENRLWPVSACDRDGPLWAGWLVHFKGSRRVAACQAVMKPVRLDGPGDGFGRGLEL